ncbi:DUF2800 domain-containing protein [Loigolactobacillus backii]|uniref:DUF2800 domain-containing protein n=1 Tax=Loigolactobacillus backii TaxID=375175 RepID=UPI0022FD3B27|nr:DUF2800 domain-containing protein [Loigolactobacillus backii]MDA5386976.1 DUF2800 domain-containing protein [Loigolactobacillus backii]MDA5389514.1 DUF2800 domain-containing protein [Loigolactobacillus backii]
MPSPTTHAKLSASGAMKWINCPPMLWMEEGLPDTTSPYAVEGTLAHSLVEAKLAYETNKITTAEYDKKLAHIKQSQFYNQSMEDFTDEHVAMVLKDYVTTDNADIYLEKRVDFSDWAPGGFGTSDTIIASEGQLQIWDLKYGKGVKVSANHNFQLMLYALGAYSYYDLLYGFESVKMTISQPRIDNLSQFEMSMADLLKWGEEVVKPAADDAMNGRGEWDFEDPHTWRFYKAAGFCRHLAEKNLEIRKYEFKEANTLKPAEIADILDQKADIERWLKSVEYYAMSQVKDGKLEIPGYKLVEGRSNRKITDPVAAENVLRKHGFAKKDITATNLLSLTALEKITGKQKFSDLLGDLILKPSGKPTLVTNDDKRPALNSTAAAQQDFN